MTKKDAYAKIFKRILTYRDTVTNGQMFYISTSKWTLDSRIPSLLMFHSLDLIVSYLTGGMLELLPNATWKNILSQSGGCFFKNFLGASAQDPFALLPHQLICSYTIFLQWFNILHKMLWNPGPMIFFIHFIFSIHIVSAVNAPYNAHHSINHFQGR